MAEYDYDVLVIGAGPGGYVAAIRAAQLGLKTACAESRETLGGTCLNVGCIPSKAMLHASEYFDAASNGTMKEMGIEVTPKLNLDAMHAQRRDAVKGLTGGIEFLFKKNKVDWKKGHATFQDAHTVKVGDETVTAKNVIIATGSSVTPLPGVEVDNEKQVVVDSTGALELKAVPKKMVVIGGGVIGLELGSVWRRLGAEVIVVEYLDKLLPGMDDDVRKEAAKIFKKQGMELRLSTKVTGCTVKGKKATLTLEPAAGGDEETLEADCVLVSIGRRPNTDGLGLENIGLETNQRGQIEIDPRLARFNAIVVPRHKGQLHLAKGGHLGRACNLDLRFGVGQHRHVPRPPVRPVDGDLSALADFEIPHDGGGVPFWTGLARDGLGHRQRPHAG